MRSVGEIPRVEHVLAAGQVAVVLSVHPDLKNGRIHFALLEILRPALGSVARGYVGNADDDVDFLADDCRSFLGLDDGHAVIGVGGRVGILHALARLRRRGPAQTESQQERENDGAFHGSSVR